MLEFLNKDFKYIYNYYSFEELFKWSLYYMIACDKLNNTKTFLYYINKSIYYQTFNMLHK